VHRALLSNAAGNSYSASALRFTMKTGDQGDLNLANPDVAVYHLQNWHELRIPNVGITSHPERQTSPRAVCHCKAMRLDDNMRAKVN